jgi:hypothetical protein
VFGAGIAGLTAAHELAMRGFEVQVIDCDYNDEPHPEMFDRGIGGMARSQWAIAADGRLAGREWLRLWSGHELLLDAVIEFDDQPEPRPVYRARAKAILERLNTAILTLRAEQLPASTIAIFVPRRPAALTQPDKGLLDDPRVRYIKEELRRLGTTDIDRMFATWDLESNPSWDSRYVYFSPGGTIVAAEHGFRFFPSFYRHLFDTMRRTPILLPRDSERTKANVFENLVPTEGLGFARDKDKVSFMIPRRAMSLEAMRKVLGQVLEQLGYTVGDIARFSLKLFKYMTSSSARRRVEYEHMSWGTFLDCGRYSQISQTHIEFGPQMSAALRGSASDARTQGNVALQLIMDQLKPDPRADYTLAGPTSSAWFDHWHEFLVRERVEFARGRLVGFKDVDGVIRPQVDGATPRGNYYVLALPLPAMVPLAARFLEVAERLPGAKDLQLDDMRTLQKFARDTTTLESDTPDSPLQHLSGIQFYFDQEVRFWRGHTQYLDSAWGLTSIAQPQFWARARTPEDDYRSILSVDIGIFNRKYQPVDGNKPAKAAWQCTADEIAQYAWEQIYDHHDDAFRKRYGDGATFPTPTAYALDATVKFGRHDEAKMPTSASKSASLSKPASASKRPSSSKAMLRFESPRAGAIRSNGSPFLVNETGAFPTRPGRLSTTPNHSKCISQYAVIAKRYVLAGTYMQTFTRLTSMESANESARHAVNAFLQAWNIGGDRCDISDPEDHELEDLQWFKDLDEELLTRGMPHFVDILGWHELPDELDQLHRFAHRFVRDRDRSNRRSHDEIRDGDTVQGRDDRQRDAVQREAEGDRRPPRGRAG